MWGWRGKALRERHSEEVIVNQDLKVKLETALKEGVGWGGSPGRGNRA